MQLLESILLLSSSSSLSGLPKSIALIRKDLLPIHQTDVRLSLEYFKKFILHSKTVISEFLNHNPTEAGGETVIEGLNQRLSEINYKYSTENIS